jgi:hypothetical protein
MNFNWGRGTRMGSTKKSREKVREREFLQFRTVTSFTFGNELRLYQFIWVGKTSSLTLRLALKICQGFFNGKPGKK